MNKKVVSLLSKEMNLNVPETDINLLEKGYLDSLSFVKMLSILEDEFDITIDMNDLDFDKFKTIEDISAFVLQKRSQK